LPDSHGDEQVDAALLAQTSFPTARASLKPSGRCRIVLRVGASPRVPPGRRWS